MQESLSTNFSDVTLAESGDSGAPNPMLGDDEATTSHTAIEITTSIEPEFEPSSSLPSAPVLGKINEAENPGRISSTSTQQSSTSSGTTFAGVKAPQMINEFFDDTDDDTRWKIFKFVSKIRERQWFKTFRSPIEFCSTGNFARPASRENFVERMRVNSQYFFTNYVILCIVILSYSIISSPMLLVCFAAFIWMWLYAQNHEEIRLFTVIPVRGRVKYGLLTTLTVLVTLYMAGSTISFYAGICLIVILLHMMFHSSVNPEDLEEFEMLPSDLP